jgi:hypothetical protein
LIFVLTLRYFCVSLYTSYVNTEGHTEADRSNAQTMFRAINV